MKTFNMLLRASIALLLGACAGKRESDVLLVGTAADLPPFEYRQADGLAGFDIELATLVGERLGREVYFQERPFNSLLANLQSKNPDVDMVAASVSITAARKQQMDLSDPYFEDDWAVVCPKLQPLPSAAALGGKRVGCQLGSTIELWVRRNAPSAEIVVAADNLHLLKELKGGKIDGLVTSRQSAEAVCRKNPTLTWHLIGEAEDEGYGFALPKNSSLTKKVNTALKQLEDSKQLAHLRAKWFRPLAEK